MLHVSGFNVAFPAPGQSAGKESRTADHRGWIQKLERSNRRLRIALALAVLVLGGLVLLGAQRPEKKPASIQRCG